MRSRVLSVLAASALVLFGFGSPRLGAARGAPSGVASPASTAGAPRQASGPAESAPEYGPAKGHLVIIGGNVSETSGLIQKFIELAGGPTKKFVIVPTNGGNHNADGSLRADFPLNQPGAEGAQILVAGDNFGCGSSREHAPWALTQYGFRAVISTSFDSRSSPVTRPTTRPREARPDRISYRHAKAGQDQATITPESRSPRRTECRSSH